MLEQSSRASLKTASLRWNGNGGNDSGCVLGNAQQHAQELPQRAQAATTQAC